MNTKDNGGETKIDPANIRAMRMDRAWSQEHLASLAGLSVRTIQRVETRGVISLESRMALASAFGVDVGALNPQRRQTTASTAALIPGAPATATSPGQAPSSDDTQTRRWLIYALVCGMLVAINLYQHGGVSWSIYPLAGWGTALLLRGALRPRIKGSCR